MSFTGQRFLPFYDEKDTKKLFEDIFQIIDIIPEEREREREREKIKNEIFVILEDNPNKAINVREEMRNILNKNIKKSSSERLFLQYGLFKKLNKLLSYNSDVFLKTLKRDIDIELEKIIGKNFDNSINIFDEVSKILENPNLFEDIKNSIEKGLGENGLIYFLEECIKRNICIDKVLFYAKENKETYQKDKNSFKYWYYSNIISLAQTKVKYEENNENIKENNQKGFILSGGISNAFSQLGYINQFVKKGGKISSISGTSMGAIIGTFIAFVGNDSSKIEDIIIKIRQKLSQSSDLKASDKKHRKEIMKMFLDIAESIGIKEDTIFNDSKIPLLINSSREYKHGEQEIILGGNKKVIESLKASVNIGGSYFGKTEIDGVDLSDFGTNEKGNPISLLDGIGIQDKDKIVIDVGYSSKNYNTPLSKFSKFFFKSALFRDFLGKQRVEKAGGIIIDIDSELSENKNGNLYSKESFNKLIEIGEKSVIN